MNGICWKVNHWRWFFSKILRWAKGWEPLGQRVERALSSSLIILSGYILNVSSMCSTAHTAVMSVPHVHPSGLHRSGSLFIRPGSVKRPPKMLCLVRCFVFLHWESDHWFVRVRTVVYDAYCMSMRSTPLIFFAPLPPRIPRQHCHVNFVDKKLNLVTVLGLDMSLLGFHLSPSLHLHAD